MVYKDVAAIFYGPVESLFVDRKHHFGPEAERIVWVAALQRLGNGVAVRLLSDADFRREFLGPHEFEDESEIGVVVFEVTVVHSDYANSIRELKVVKKHHYPIKREAS